MDKINLNDIKDKYFTGRRKKIKLEWSAKDMNVYRIPIEYLYYNDQNDRIATYISKYDTDHKDKPFSTLPTHDKERNDIIESYIIEADKGNFDTIKDHIKDNSQMDPWVVLSDWRVIDGNRRFTSLRSLRRETGEQEYAFFETVILDDNVDEKQIKIMELILQQWLPSRLNYNPIEKLVWVYRDLIRDKRLTVKEYAKSINEKDSEVEKLIDLALLMEDFLEHMNAPQEFYLAKELEIDWPLRELYRVKKKIEADEDDWYKTKVSVYNLMIIRPEVDWSNDITRIVRDFCNNIALSKEKLNEYYSEHEDEARFIFEAFRWKSARQVIDSWDLSEDNLKVSIDKKSEEKFWDWSSLDVVKQDSSENENSEEKTSQILPQFHNSYAPVDKKVIFDDIKRVKKEVSEHMWHKVADALYEAKQEKKMSKPIDYLIEANKTLKKINSRSVKDLDMISRVKFIEELEKIENIINQINKELEWQN